MSEIGERTLRVDWPACRANGICARVAPDLISLDDWGYPVVSPRPVPASREPVARAAVVKCPTLALRLVDVPVAAGTRRERRKQTP
jgi:ferredoxin